MESTPLSKCVFFSSRRMVSSDDWSNRHRWIRFGAKVWCTVVEASNTKAAVAEVESAHSDSMAHAFTSKLCF